MVGAYLAEGILPQLRINIAKVTIVQKGAPFVFPENKMSCGAAGNILFKALSEFAAYGAVTGKAFVIYIYLPAYAAVMAAGRGSAFEVIVIIGKNYFHINPPCGSPAQIVIINPHTRRIIAVNAVCPQGEALGF